MGRIIRTIILSILIPLIFSGCGSGDTSTKRIPTIGVSCEFVDGGFNKVKERYIDAVRKAGGVPLILPRVRTEAEADEALALVDGILFIGGDDVNPALYGEEPLNGSVVWNDAQDSSDFLLIKAALKRKTAVLGICRGMQTLNVVLGGSLWQDIPSQIEGALPHRQTESTFQATHTVTLDHGSRLAHILGTTSFDTNSHHHQAVRDVARGLKAVGFTEDGVIEAVEGKNIIAVQSHPENLVTAGNTALMPIFTDFIQRSSK